MAASDWESAKLIAETLQAGLTCIGILIGAGWVLRKRERFPRATVSQRVHAVRFEDKHLVRVETTLTNIGHVIIRLSYSRTRLQLIRPIDLTSLVDSDGKLTRCNGREAPWPTLEELEYTFKKKECEIEPGEAQTFEHDFLVESSTEAVQVDAYFQNIKKMWWRRQIGWNATTIAEIDAKREFTVKRLTEQMTPKPRVEVGVEQHQLPPKPAPPVIDAVPATPSTPADQPNMLIQMPPKPSTPVVVPPPPSKTD